MRRSATLGTAAIRAKSAKDLAQAACLLSFLWDHRRVIGNGFPLPLPDYLYPRESDTATSALGELSLSIFLNLPGYKDASLLA